MYAWRVRVRGVCVACARSWRGVHMYLYVLQLTMYAIYIVPVYFIVKLRLHTAINRADFVSWWMWFTIYRLTTKVHRHFLTECILLPLYVYNMHQDTKSTWLIAVCKHSFNRLVSHLLHKYGTMPCNIYTYDKNVSNNSRKLPILGKYHMRPHTGHSCCNSCDIMPTSDQVEIHSRHCWPILRIFHAYLCIQILKQAGKKSLMSRFYDSKKSNRRTKYILRCKIGFENCTCHEFFVQKVNKKKRKLIKKKRKVNTRKWNW